MNETENKKENPSTSFDYRGIGDIDLSEAEKIANEEILFLSEDDLIEGLEDFELIPIKTEKEPEKSEGDSDRIPGEEIPSTPVAGISDEHSAVPHRDDTAQPVEEEPVSEIFPGEESGESGKSDTVTADSMESDYSDYKEAEADTVEQPVTGLDDFEESVIEDISWPDDNGSEIEAADIFSDEQSDSEAASPEAGREFGDFEPEPLEDGQQAVESEQEFSETGELEIDFDRTEYQKDPDQSAAPETASFSEESILPDDSPAPADSFSERPKEILSDEISAIETGESEVRFIDDDLVDKPLDEVSGTTQEESAFNSLTSRMSQIITGRPLILTDSTHDHKKQFFVIEPDAALHSLEGMLDDPESGEYRFRDDEIDFIHSEIIRDDYKDYLRNIDIFHETIGKKYISETIDIFGLTRYEAEEIEKDLFEREFEGVDLDQLFDFYITDKMFRGVKPSIKGTYTYIQKSVGTLDENEKLSIEADITSENAVIFEEDVEDIKNLYRFYTGKDVEIEKPRTPDPPEAAGDEELYDITDRVVIIEDDDDVDRFVADIPEHKRTDIKKLLKYLDGLFEKLPETVIKNFASSEYFNLYQKVLNELEE